jgi:hypothetical protein
MTLPAPDYGKPWDSPANEFWANFWMPVYCWSGENSPERLQTNVVAITGPGTPFGEEKLRIHDMSPHTILLVEMAHSGIHWMAPGDLSVDDMCPSLVKGVDGDGFLVAFPNGEVWFLSADVPLENVKKFCTIEGAKKYNRDEVLGRYALSRPSR